LSKEHEELLRQLMDPGIGKTEREHAAAGEVARLRARVAELEEMAADLEGSVNADRPGEVTVPLTIRTNV